METRTDEEIVLAVQRGNAEDFGILVERYEERLSRYARKFLISGEDTKDLMQDIFMKAYVNVQSFDGSRKFSSWIYRIAHNEFINTIKKRSRLPIPFFDPDILFPHPVAEESADTAAQKNEMRRLLDASLSKLDPKYREPLVLYYFEDMDYRQIAEVLQIPASTVGVRLQRGRAILRKTFGNYHG